MKLLNDPIWRKGISVFLAMLILVFTTGCNYFRVREISPENLPSLQAPGKVTNYFVLNYGEQQLQLKDLNVSSTFLTAQVDTLTKKPYYHPKREGMRYKNAESSIVHEVHIYLKRYVPYEFVTGETKQIAIGDIEKILVIDPNTGLTVASYVGCIVGIPLGFSTILFIIIALTKDSCPYVYANTGETFVMEGEIYSGAIFKGLERHDYLPLPHIQPVDGTYQIRIANELKEQQHTNLANLKVIHHPAGTEAWMDQQGQAWLVTNPVSPTSAITGMGADRCDLLGATDENKYFFDEEEADTNRLCLDFPKPDQAQTGTLLLNLKNTLWGDFVYGEFSKKMGHFYTTWVEMQNRKSTVEVQRRMDEMGFPLRLYLETADGWQPLPSLHLVGPLGNRDLAVPIDLSRVKGPDVRLRLESSFMFWEIDYTAMDFSAQPVDALELKPAWATGTAESNARAALMADDALYLDQWVPGDVTEVHFAAPPTPEGDQTSCFLHTKGYYNHVRDYTWTPEYAELFKFRQPGHFDAFSKELYRQLQYEQEPLMANH